MPTLHLLGTGAALAAPERTTTMLALQGDSSVVIDCGGDVGQRLLMAGIEMDSIRVVVLTHEHPDHVGGFPLFMEKLWLSGRRRPLPVRGPDAALDQARRVFESFDTSGWKGMPEIEWQSVALEEGSMVWTDDEWRITAAPGKHSVPVIGVRVEYSGGDGAVAFSSDTEGADAIARLASGVDILVHEASGAFPGHSTATTAARIGREAEAEKLVLVHLPPASDDTDDDFRQAEEIFPGVTRGEDGARYTF